MRDDAPPGPRPSPNEPGLLWLFRLSYDWKQIPPLEGYLPYMQALLICAKGDGEVSEAERAYVVGYAAAYGASPAMLEQLRRYEALESIDEVVARAPFAEGTPPLAIYDAFRVCAADGVLHEQEVARIFAMARLLKVPDQVTRELHQIFLVESYLRERRLALFFPHGNPLA